MPTVCQTDGMPAHLGQESRVQGISIRAKGPGQILAPSLTSHVTMDQLLNLSEPQHLHLYTGVHDKMSPNEFAHGFL
jgi:hypothetical protein